MQMVETRIRWNGVLCTFIIFTIAFLRNRSNTKVKKLGRIETRSSEKWKLESKQRNSTLRFEIYVGGRGSDSLIKVFFRREHSGFSKLNMHLAYC